MQEKPEIVIDKKQIHFGQLHKMIQVGGTIKFRDYPFGIRLVGNGSPFITIELFALKANTEYKGHVNPSAPSKPKLKVEKVEVEESDEIEM